MRLNEKIIKCAKEHGWNIDESSDNYAALRCEPMKRDVGIYEYFEISKKNDEDFISSVKKFAENFDVYILVEEQIKKIGVLNSLEKMIEEAQTVKNKALELADALSSLSLSEKYAITIEDTLRSTVIVEANNKEEALKKVSDIVGNKKLNISDQNKQVERKIILSDRFGSSGIIPDNVDIGKYASLENVTKSDKDYIYQVYKNVRSYDCWGATEYNEEYYCSFAKEEDAKRCIKKDLASGGRIKKERLY